MAECVLSTPNHTVIRSQWCELDLRRLAPDAVLMTLTGVGEAEAGDLLLPALDRMIDGKRVHVFVDAWEPKSYAPAFRRVLTDFARRALPHLQAIEVLIQSRLVAMGTALSSALLGGKIHAVATRKAFDAALASATGHAVDREATRTDG